MTIAGLSKQLLLAALLAAAVLAGAPSVTQACSGSTFPLALAAARADAIYYATIRSVAGGGNGFYTVDVTYGGIYRGEAQSHVARLVVGEPCRYAVEPLESGVLLLGVRQPFNGPPGETGNLFYLVGPGGISYHDAIVTLHNLPPPTDTADPMAPTPIGQSGLSVLAAGLVAFVLLFWRRRPRLS